MRKIAGVGLILFGCVWPFALHWFAMHRLFMKLGQDPRYWLAYAIFLTILPTPVIIYAGFHTALRDQVPENAMIKVAGMGSALVFLATSLIYLLVVGGIGFSVPI
ncbi:MAG: hypothetical protein HY925_01250 [Elusimicrobia bacterium]|nr:hypothetical protein [Elusimicrobiota bacterium]